MSASNEKTNLLNKSIRCDVPEEETNLLKKSMRCYISNKKINLLDKSVCCDVPEEPYYGSDADTEILSPYESESDNE